MRAWTDERRSFLQEKFGNRVTFDEVERMLYEHDVAAMPPLVKPLVGNTVPDVVVQPKDEQELSDLVCWAYERDIPLTPRAKATSGYGGVIPVKKGIVVDFFYLGKVLDIDPEGLTATVQPGITWEQLDRSLKFRDLTLRLYPTSYPSSSVGGWLAQGGAGLGSYEYGMFRENVVSARVVLPTGEIREFGDDDLELIADAEGITGFISSVTLKVQPAHELDVVTISSPGSHELQALMEAIVAADLPIWTMMFINPTMARLRNGAPLREHMGHAVEERVDLPEAYVMTLAFREGHSQQVRSALPELLLAHGAELLDQHVADHEWANRFKLMLIKRLGPSLVPAEAIVPLSQAGNALEEIERKLAQPIVKEAVVIRDGANGEPEVVILGFIPADERKFSYHFVFGLVLTIMKIARKHGGRPYSTGMYFSNQADEVMGRERVARLRTFRDEVDPKHLLNPGKVIDRGAMSHALSAARWFEPLIRPFGNAIEVQVGERPEDAVLGIPADVAWYAYTCAQCGYCVEDCTQFAERGWESQSPRGKWYWLRQFMEGRVKWDQKMVDSVVACTTCERCDRNCALNLPVEPSWMKLRGQLIDTEKRMTFPPFEMMSAALAGQGNIWAGYRENRTDWFPEDLEEKHGPDHESKTVYFAGCTASYVEPDIAQASVRLLDEAGVDFTYLGEKENCCATPMLAAGKWELFAETMKKNIDAVKEAGGDTVVSSCPACDMMWRHVYPQWADKLGIDYDIEAKHYSEVLAEKINDGEFEFPETDREPVTVTWHDSCHIGRASGVYEPPRDLIKAIPGVDFVEMASCGENSKCCGSVLTLIKDPETAHELGKSRLDEAVEAGADKVLALCPCCEFQLRVSAEKRDVPVEVQDLAHFSAAALGYEFADPHPEVRAQWAVFESMIALMTPRGFADLMGTMWPELIDAMPFGMGRMMRLMGKIPGALDLMRPMFPILFPRLLPLMMPKVMPAMLERIAGKVPMPDYMAEQMPQMMPQVMDNLMPHMIGDVVPLVTEPMLDYLKGRDAA